MRALAMRPLKLILCQVGSLSLEISISAGKICSVASHHQQPADKKKQVMTTCLFFQSLDFELFSRRWFSQEPSIPSLSILAGGNCIKCRLNGLALL